MKLRFQADADLNQIIVLATVRREPWNFPGVQAKRSAEHQVR